MSKASLFDTVLGLPLHPLVVHAVVVLLPLACLGLLGMLVVPAWRTRFGWATWALLAAGTGTAFVAKESGEQLERHTGVPADHAAWGERLPLVAAVVLVLATAWLLVHTLQGSRTQSRAVADLGVAGSSRVARTGGAASTALGALTGLAASACLAVTVVTGHSGAEAAWGGTVSAAAPTSAATPAPTPAPSGGASSSAATSAGASGGTSSASSAPGSYTMAQVKQHNSAASCWTAINGTVYDVTSWVGQHPGGQAPILSLCGTDGTAAFSAQHGTQRKPNTELAGFRIGTLAG